MSGEEHFARADALDDEGRHAEALAVLDELLADPGVEPRYAGRAWALKAVVLDRLGRREESAPVYAELLARFGTTGDEAVRVRIAYALYQRGELLDDEGRHAEALAAFDELLVWCGDATPRLDLVVDGLLMKASALDDLGRQAEALAIYTMMRERYRDVADPGLDESLVRGMALEGWELRERGRDAEALAVYDELLARFPASRAIDDDGARIALVKAADTRLWVLRALGRDVGEGLAALVARFGPDPSAGVRSVAAQALADEAMLRRDREPARAMAAVDELLARFGDDPDRQVRSWVASGQLSKATILAVDGAGGAALAAYGAAIADGADVTVAFALNGRATILEERGLRAEAIALYEQVLARFGGATDPELRAQVVSAEVWRAWNLERLRRFRRASRALFYGGLAAILLREVWRDRRRRAHVL